MNHRTKQRRPKLSPEQKEAIYALPLAKQFRIVHADTESGFFVFQHRLVDENERDYQQVLTVAKAYAQETNCWINPIVMPQAVEARQKLYPGIEDGANPDLTTDKYGYIDVKSPHNKSNIVSNANHACRQGAIAVLTDLMLDEKLNHKRIMQVTAKIFSDTNRNHHGEPNYHQDQIHWFVKGKILKYNKPEKNSSPA